MTNFERLAIFTMVESIEKQLHGLKILLASQDGATSPHMTTAVPQYDPSTQNVMSESDEEAIAKHLGMARQLEIERMEQNAGKEFGKLWEETAQESEKLEEPN